MGCEFRPIVGLIGGVCMADLHNGLNDSGGGVLGFWWGFDFGLFRFRGGWTFYAGKSDCLGVAKADLKV